MADEDAWGTPNKAAFELAENTENSAKNGFQDNFVAAIKEDLERLPDHEDYLEKLENKLTNLKKKTSIAKELAVRRSDEARRMLEASAAAIELFEDQDVSENSSAITRRLFPEKQALTMSEIAKLLESDSLANNAVDDGSENTEVKNPSADAE